MVPNRQFIKVWEFQCELKRLPIPLPKHMNVALDSSLWYTPKWKFRRSHNISKVNCRYLWVWGSFHNHSYSFYFPICCFCPIFFIPGSSNVCHVIKCAHTHESFVVNKHHFRITFSLLNSFPTVTNSERLGNFYSTHHSSLEKKNSHILPTVWSPCSFFLICAINFPFSTEYNYSFPWLTPCTCCLSHSLSRPFLSFSYFQLFCDKYMYKNATDNSASLVTLSIYPVA